jgi:hypothetical protein
MAMHTETLTAGTWYELSDLDEENFVFLHVDSSDTVILAFDAISPSSSSDVGGILIAGWNSIPIPIGKYAWVKLLSGSADVTYSKFGGISIDVSKCAFVGTDTIDEIVSTGTPPICGFDSTPVNDYTYIGLLHTEASGLSAAATIDDAVLSLTFAKSLPGREFVIYGIAETASVTSGITDYASLASGQTLTTASVLFEVDYSGRVSVDIAAIVQELVDLAGWTTSSPIQLWVADNLGMPVSAIDATILPQPDNRRSAIFVTAT